MWFMFPKGVRQISVERQQFNIEVLDADGRGYFRAPDHFAPRILAIKDFIAASKPPEGAPDDLPKADPLRDGAIAGLTAQLEAMKLEITNLRTDLAVATAKIGAMTREKLALEEQLEASKALAEGLREQIEDSGNEPNVASIASARKK